MVAATKTQKKCVKGFPCGYSCQNKDKTCRNPLSGQSASYQEYLKSQGEKLAEPKKTSTKGKAKSKTESSVKTKIEPQKSVATKEDKPVTHKPVQHKPFMTEQEAIEYTKNSVWKDRVFFHGTNTQGGQSITSSGVDITKNNASVYGKGFYVGGSDSPGSKKGWDIAVEYSSVRHESASVLEMKINATKPWVGTSAEFGKMRMERQKNWSIDQSDYTKAFAQIADMIHESLSAEGYDSIHITDKSYFVVFDPSQVAIYANHKLQPSDGKEDYSMPSPVQKRIKKEK